MKIAAVYCIYNEEDYIAYSARSVYDFVDAIVILLGLAPWTAYNPDARTAFGQRDRTEAIVDELARGDAKVVVVKDVWDSDLAQRETGLRICRELGCDYYFLVDGDEIYRRDHLAAIREELAHHPDVGTFHVKCTVLWRSFRYCIPYPRVKWTPWRIFNITRSRKVLGIPVPYRCRVVGPNRINSPGPRHLIPPERAIFYHLGYARTNARMQLKLGTSDGRHQFIDGWYERVWLKWPADRSIKNLQPVDPEGLPEAVPLDRAELPEVLREHPYWNLEIIE